MLLWKGETEAERGFKNTLAESENWDFTFALFDAEQDTKLLGNNINALDLAKYRLIYTSGTTVTKFAKERIKGYPIIYNAISHPVRSDIIESWTHSGSTISGVSSSVPLPAVHESIMAMGLVESSVNLRVGFIYDPTDEDSAIHRDEIMETNIVYGCDTVFGKIEGVGDFDALAVQMKNEEVDMVVLSDDPLVTTHASTIIKSLSALKIPTVALMPQLARENGALIGLGADYYQLGEMAAKIALQILNGARPTDVESKRPQRLERVINLTTAEAVGVTFSEEALKGSEIVR